MIQRDLGDGIYASYDEPASPPAGHEDADPARPLTAPTPERVPVSAGQLTIHKMSHFLMDHDRQWCSTSRCGEVPVTADPGRPLYPDVTVHLSTGCPANMGSVMDKVRDAFRQAGEDTNVMNRIWAEVLEAGSFTEALSIVMRWVNVT